ncbi:MAG: hypothetical protein GEU91_06425 [Rhizobiales bacterium]|nr:hypothetical protein [Hyphomicrobiales bacterium]
MRSHSTSIRQCKTIVLGVAAALLAGSLAVAQERDRPRHKDSADSSSTVEPQAVANAPNARLVALVRADDGRVVLKKGVRSVRRIATGVYCIRPEGATGIDPQTAVAVVSVEYFYSLFNEVQVQWARRANGCGNDRLGVYTLADQNLDGVYTFSNAVGFVIYVP